MNVRLNFNHGTLLQLFLYNKIVTFFTIKTPNSGFVWYQGFISGVLVCENTRQLNYCLNIEILTFSSISLLPLGTPFPQVI